MARLAPIAPVTPEGLHAAWLRRRAPHWPPTFEATMEHPLLSRVVRLEAITAAVAARHAAQRQMPVSSPHRPARPPRGFTTSLHFDARRAAANDLDDDDDDQ